MKAIILASGSGSRLLPLTEEIPKSLIKINGETILDIEIDNLIECGIKKFIITTGYCADKIERHVKKYPDINFTLIRNEKYDTTNYIYSMWLTRNFADDDIVLLHGDMVFERSLLHKLIASESPNAVLVNTKIKAPHKDFKAKISDNIVKHIGVGLHGEKAYFCAPIYKFSKASFQKWLNQIELFIQEGRVKCYAEDALNQIADNISLKPIFYEDEFCMEIDTYNDFETARKYYRNRIQDRKDSYAL